MSKLDVQQMDLKTFAEFFGIKEKTVKEWIHIKNFPSYKLGGKWYVDIPEFYKWRKLEHTRSYKYA